MATLAPKEKGPNQLATVETAKLVVNQPQKLQELNLLLESFDALDRRVSERTGEDRSQDLGSAGSSAAGAAGQQTQASPRDVAIAAMPAEPAVLQRELASHINAEVRRLHTLAKKVTRASRPGDAFRLNEIYARIRRLNALLAQVFEASMELLRRLFIRVFIDKQPII